MTYSTAASPAHPDAGIAPRSVPYGEAEMATASLIDRNTLGLVAGTATILTVKITMLWAALQPL